MWSNNKTDLMSDPVRIGPGIWFNIHMKAKKATDEKGKKEFIDDMYMYYDEFPCGNCREHIQEYMNTHSFEPFMNMKNDKGREIGMFKWAWMFHNAVNTRLKKPYVEWETACEMYSLDDGLIEPCTSCGSDEKIETLQTDKEKIIQGYFLQKGLNETLEKIRF